MKRIWPLALFITGIANAQSPRAAPDTQTVVFVCEHGTVKSVIAMAYFDRLARERGLRFRAVSRGTAPDSAVPRFVRDWLGRDGFDLAGFAPLRLSESDLRAALVVSFDQPMVAEFVGRRAHAAWDRLPSVTAHYPTARDSIKRRIAALVDSLVRAR